MYDTYVSIKYDNPVYLSTKKSLNHTGQILKILPYLKTMWELPYQIASSIDSLLSPSSINIAPHIVRPLHLFIKRNISTPHGVVEALIPPQRPSPPQARHTVIDLRPRARRSDTVLVAQC
jgi:hypothetical protein